jgi:hypothetical protein
VPLLIGLQVPDLSGPLSHFNAALLDRDEIARLVAAINAQLGAARLTDKQLDKAFATWWPGLEESLQAAAKKAAAGLEKFIYDVFLSTPMAAFDTNDEYKAGWTRFRKVFDALKGEGLKVYWAAEDIDSKDKFDSLDVSVLDDLKALQQSRRFMLLYPQKLVTSALFEAGYALALKRFSHYFVRDRDDLPFLMREIAGPDSNVRIHTDQDWKDYDDLAAKIHNYRETWFGA